MPCCIASAAGGRCLRPMMMRRRSEDEMRRHVAVPLSRLSVRCEACGHQAVVRVAERLGRELRLRCRSGSTDVEIERA